MSLTTTYKSCNFIFPLAADYQKTDEQREREVELIEQLVSVVNKRDQLVQFEDSQLQQAEKDALHVEKVINSARMPKDRNAECVLQ